MLIGFGKTGELHLTRVSAVCALQPLPHHLDALSDMQKADARALRSGEGQPQEAQARAINMTVKKTDDDELEVGEIGKTLRSMQAEKWQSLDWIDQDVRPLFRSFSTCRGFHGS